MRKTHAVIALGLAGFFGVAACTATPPPPSPPQATSQPAQQATSSPPAPQATSQPLSRATSQPAQQVTSPPAPQATSQPAQQATSQPGAGTVKVVTDETFAGEVLASSKPVLVDYWAEWCGPCRMVAPVLEQIAAEHADKITIVKLNIDENSTVPGVYGVETIPTMDLFSNGQAVKRITGAQPKSVLLRDLAGYI